MPRYDTFLAELSHAEKSDERPKYSPAVSEVAVFDLKVALSSLRFPYLTQRPSDHFFVVSVGS